MLLELVKNYKVYYSNTTLVKVKLPIDKVQANNYNHSNTTLVKVKYYEINLLGQTEEFKYNTC